MSTAHPRNRSANPIPPSEVLMELLLFLVVVFLVFMVAGWGWRRGRSGV
jgi:hypothetical protein